MSPKSAFRTGVVVDDVDMDVAFDPVMIRKDYLKTWFTIDLASSIPWDILISIFTDRDGSEPNHASFVRFLKVMTILKLLRGKVQ